MDGFDRRERRRRYRRQQQLKEYGIVAAIVLGILLFLGGLGFLGVRLFGVLTASDGAHPKTKVQQTADETITTESYMKKTKPLKGVTIMVDPGHGERVPGCVVGDIMEKDITLAVSLKLRTMLKEAGAKVRMTREDDATYPRLKERGAMANKAKVDYFISIHCNSYMEDTSIYGFESYYYDETSKALSEQMTEAAKEAKIPVQSSKYGNFQVLRDTKMPAVLLEIGYMSNPSELANMTDDTYQQKLAEAITSGLIKVGL